MALPTSPTSQFSMTVITRIEPSKLGRLREVLARIGEQTTAAMRGQAVSGERLIPFEALDTIHYARWVIIDAYERFGTGPLLAFSTNYDGPVGHEVDEPAARRRHVAQLVEGAKPGLDEVYGCCVGYPGAGTEPEELEAYLSAPDHQYRSATFYTGSSGRSRDQILGEAELRRGIDRFIDQEQRAGTLSIADDPQTVREAVQEQFGVQPSFPPQPDHSLRIKATFWGIALGILAALVALGTLLSLTGALSWLSWSVILVLAAAGAVGLALAWLRHLEKTDPEYRIDYSKTELAHIEWASVGENLFLQNQLTHLVDIKVGWFRAMLIRFVFANLQFLATYEYNKGKLGNIPSIHFARWVIMDRGRRLLFFSNFDSSWESYLSDFIDQASGGLTGVWSNTVLYPRTRFLLYAGSRAAARFKAWTRHYQVPTQVWYCAYPGLSIRNVNDNTVIRRGLAERSSVSASQWLGKLG